MNNISLNNFKELHIKGYNLDMIYILSLLNENIDISLLNESIKIKNIISVMERKGLIDSHINVTLDGKNLLEFINNKEDLKLIKRKIDTEIDIFWKIFPSSDSFEYKGKKFNGSRALRINKEGCKLKLDALLNEGTYSFEEIIKAIEYDILNKKEMSLRGGQNKLTYVQNSVTYLSQRAFEPYIELSKNISKEENIIPEETKNLFG